MPIEIVEGPFIDAGQSLSNGVDCSRGEIVRLTMPADWTDAPLTFQMSSDGGFYNDVVDYKGSEVSVVVVPGAAVVVPVNFLGAAAFIKFRSGNRNHPITQPAGRLFAIALKVPDTVTEPPPEAPILKIKLVP